jgi:hypothetical protein
MTDGGATRETGHRPSRGLFLHVFAVASAAAFFFYVLFQVLLLTPLSASLLERLLSRYTGSKVTVGGFSLSGVTARLDTVAIESPAGFRERRFLSARSISVTPDPTAFIVGRKFFSHIIIDGLRIDVAKNSAGSWNFSGLLELLTEKKPEKPGETFIGRLYLRDASLRVNGYGFDGLGLAIDNISTRGTTESKVEISAKDPAGNPVRLAAEGRLGADPAFRLKVSVPVLSLSAVREAGKGVRFLDPGAATAGVSFGAEFRHGVLDARGNCGLDHLGINLGREKITLRTSLDFAVRWDTRRDEAFLERATLTVNDIVKLRASGSMRGIRQDGIFSLRYFPEPIRLAGLVSIFPEKIRREIIVDGILTSPGGYLEGSRKEGITGGRGSFSIRSASFTDRGRILIRGAGTDFSAVAAADGWQLNGRIFAAEKGGIPILESLEAPFSARFSSRFTPVRVEFPTVRAAVMGIPVSGRFRYLPSLPEPFSVACSVEGTPLSVLNSRLKQPAIRFTSGTGKAEVRLSGASVRDFAGSVTAAVSSAVGTVAGKSFSLRDGRLASEVRRSGGRFSAGGGLALVEGMAQGKKCGVSLGYSFADEVLTLRNGDLSWGGTKVGIASATVRLPFEKEKGGESGFPLVAAFSGGGIRAADVSVSGMAGRIDGRLFSGGPKRRLEGTADLVLTDVSFRGKHAASLTGRATFTGSGATVNIKGDSLGGKLDAVIRSDLFSREGATSFTVRLQEQRMESVQGLLPPGTRPRLSGGSANLSFSGTYARHSGLSCTLTGAGNGISLVGEGGKTLVSDVGLTIDSRVAGENLSIKEAVLSQSQGVKARVIGNIERFTSFNRKGSVTFTLPTTRISTMLDACANALPRTLQEAVCEGTCSLEGVADISGRDLLMRGGITLDGGALEIPSQKLHVTGISGTVPLSLLIPGKGGVRKASAVSFSRENYPKLLLTLGGEPATGNRLGIGMLRFGALQMGPLTFFMHADRGVLEIVSIDGTLYHGRLLGSSFVLYNNGFEYGGDLLLNDLSLTRFCESFPAIKGYITGRVDGVISLLNVKGGIGGTSGYVNLWTRGGKGEKMSVSKEFLQKLAGKKLRGFLFTNDRAYDTGEISAYLRSGYLTFERLDISHTNFLGMKDLSVTVVPVQNRIAFEHLLDSIRQATARSKSGNQGDAPVQTDLKWLE